jgi:uncharacterized protein (DUF58 family)
VTTDASSVGHRGFRGQAEPVPDPRPRAAASPPDHTPRNEPARKPAGHESTQPTLRPVPNTRLGRAFARWRPPRKLRSTREGKYFIAITLGVGLAAINTGNNLLYLLLGMLLALVILSGMMSELSLRNLTVLRRLPARAQVGRPHLVEIEVFNHKKRVPSYAIEVEDLRAGQPADKRCFFLKISPNSAQVAAYRRSPQRRGRDCHIGFRIATRFPFGLFEKSREVSCDGELVIYPPVDPIRLPNDDTPRKLAGTGSLGRGSGDDMLGLRPMREGDDPRDIYWRKSTLLGQMVLRERARESRPDVELHLDVRRPPDAGEDWAARFERRIRDVASRAVAHLKRGDDVTVISTAHERIRSDASVGADRILRFLALVEPVALEDAALHVADAQTRPRNPARPNARPDEDVLR